jgi:hypothetical protein
MKYFIEVEMITGTKHKSIPTDIDESVLSVFRNLEEAKHIQIPISETQGVILSPKHIVSLTLTEIPE